MKFSYCPMCGEALPAGVTPKPDGLGFPLEAALCSRCELANLKAQLLEDYARKKPHRFHQFDGIDLGPGDDVMRPDADGDCLSQGDRWELRSGCVPVRVQVLAGTSQETAIRLVQKIASWIQRTGLRIVEEERA